jgi:hypothetical protein
MFLANLSRRARDVRACFETVRKHGPLARQDTGKPLWSQTYETLRLLKGTGRLEPDEYYQYRLYDDRRFTWEQKKQFLGRRMENDLIPILDESWWLGLANDKVIAHAFFRGLGFPTPDLYAVYHPWRGIGDIPVVRTNGAFADFVRQLAVPFVAKPVYGMWGRHVLAVQRYEPSHDSVVLGNHQEMSVDAFVERCVGIPDKGGILLQELLAPHHDVQEQCGSRICSVRMVTLMDKRGPRLLATVWKVATGGSMADNYWEPGNLVAPIDAESGLVGRTFTGLGRDIRHVDTHPDTGRTLPGFRLPDWREAVDLCLRATSAIPRLPMQAWDVALTTRGPVLLEVNVNGGMRLPQLCAEAGLYQGQFAEFLGRFGYPRPSRQSRRKPRAEQQHAHPRS